MRCRRPYTFVVFALLILILGVFSIESMPTDIFPNIDIPVVTVVWNYTGLSAEEMANRIVSNYERGMTTTVNDIDHIESQSLIGVAVIKIFFQPDVNIGQAVAQVTAISQVQLRRCRRARRRPSSSSTTHRACRSCSSDSPGEGLNEQQLNDFGHQLHPHSTGHRRRRADRLPLRRQAAPDPGRSRSHALQARGLSPIDVVNAIGAQNLILPSGTVKIGPLRVPGRDQLRAHDARRSLNDLPIKTVNGAIVYVRDVAHVRDGFPPQTNIVRVDGQRAMLDDGAEERASSRPWTSSPGSSDCCRSLRQHCRRS